MSPKTLIQRKFKIGWSDVQLLVLMQLGEDALVPYAELVVKTGASETGVWNALAHIRDRGCLETFIIEGRTHYLLNETGREMLAKILAR